MQSGSFLEMRDVGVRLVVLVAILASCRSTDERGLAKTASLPQRPPLALYAASHALVVGNGNYTRGWDPLRGAVEDSGKVAEVLRRKGFDVRLETNLSSDRFEEALQRFIRECGQEADARLLIYYAGHGYTERLVNGDDLGYLVMCDAPRPLADPDGFTRKSVNMQEIVTQAKRIRSRHVLFVFDSCFSGTILNLRNDPKPEAVSDNARYPVRQFITAGRANEPVPDHSAFTQSFVDLLDGKEKEPVPDGYLTGEEIGLFLKYKVPQYNPAQHPQYGKILDPALDKGDFVFEVGGPVASLESEGTIAVSSEPPLPRVVSPVPEILPQAPARPTAKPGPANLEDGADDTMPEPGPNARQGLLLCYGFDQDDGGKVADLSGNGHDAKVEGAKWDADGVVGGAMRFREKTDRLVASDRGMPAGDAPRSIAVWVKWDELVSATFLSYGSEFYAKPPDNQFCGLMLDTRVGRNAVAMTQDGGVFVSSEHVEAGRWYHVVYTYGGNRRHRMYVDGIERSGVNELYGSLNTILHDGVIAGAQPVGAPFKGMLDEVRIYDYALTEAEVATLSSKGRRK